jgi:hypothetical protein
MQEKFGYLSISEKNKEKRKKKWQRKDLIFSIFIGKKRSKEEKRGKVKNSLPRMQKKFDGWRKLFQIKKLLKEKIFSKKSDEIQLGPSLFQFPKKPCVESKVFSRAQLLVKNQELSSGKRRFVFKNSLKSLI